MIASDKVEVLAQVDVLVIGAGSAGCCAAISSAQQGANTMIVDRYGFAGGTSTAVLDTFYGFFTPGETPRKVVGGIPDQVVDALAKHDAMFLRPNTYGAGTGVTYNPDVLKWVWDRLLISNGVKLLLHTLLIDVEMDTAGRIIGVVVATRQGLRRIKAKRFIDASGDAELCHLAQILCEKAGEIDPAQTLTTTFRMVNVDFEKFNAAGGKQMLSQKMAAVDLEKHPLPRRKGSFHAMPIPGCAATVAVRVADVDPMDSEQLTDAEVQGRQQAFVFEKFVRECVPGYEKACIGGLSVHIGVRESRRVYGEYRLTRDDCMTARTFEDTVLVCGAPIEDHRQGKDGQDETAWAYVPDGQVYHVPYRTLIAKDRDELWVVGRCFSATHDAHASCRSMGQTMSMGQAAGMAAAMSLDQACGARDVSVTGLQDQLRTLGAVLQMPDKPADISANGWGANR
ncbi:MAG: FAD-dependent oxidoreductase [Phycisphaeraceae bacterium]|nr:FAD-dependent oxidoreductase [Phycisphaeraceae bacterium]